MKVEWPQRLIVAINGITAINYCNDTVYCDDHPLWPRNLHVTPPTKTHEPTKRGTVALLHCCADRKLLTL